MNGKSSFTIANGASDRQWKRPLGDQCLCAYVLNILLKNTTGFNSDDGFTLPEDGFLGICFVE